jgi:hypothetical protein
MTQTRWALAVVLIFSASSALASVTYVGEVPTPFFGFGSLLDVVQTPLSPGDPTYVPGIDPRQWTINTFSYTQYNGSFPAQFPLEVKLGAGSQVAIGGQWNGDPLMYLYSNQLVQLITYDPTTGTVVHPSPFLNFVNNIVDSIAVSQKGVLTMIADNTGYQVSTTTGADTQIFSETGGTAPGQFSDALYQSYGPDGLLYVLDYGNGRVQGLDPNNNFAPVSQFNLESGVVTANMQFAISNTGVFYFGDGAGGGTSYAPDGTYLGSFSTSVSNPVLPAGSEFYVSADGKGDVFVFDPTGAHQFLDTPEPSTFPLLLVGIAGAILLSRKRAPEVS